MKSDIEIAYENHMEEITTIAKKVGILETEFEQYGKYKAKLSLELLKKQDQGKLILVTSINPTKAGEGKSTTMIGLADSLAYLGKHAMVAMREPSFGPVLGQKGGATGGGFAQVQPMADINMHFTGDMHAITTANNTISAILDNHIYQGNELRIDPERITWKRALDLNDRTLREIIIGQGKKINGPARVDGFNITVASEIMAILCLAKDLEDLRTRISRIIVGETYDCTPVTVEMLGCTGVVMMILKDAMKPNLVQTLYHTPAIVHGGPFANIAHGCNSIIGTKTALKLADYVVTEAGFGADLGAEKFLNIKCDVAGIVPNLVVIVATIRALKMHGGEEQYEQENIEALKKGIANLERHIESIQNFKLPYVVAINEFASDTPKEIATLFSWAEEHHHPVACSSVFKEGPIGGIDLANKVLELLEHTTNHAFTRIYQNHEDIETKILKIAQQIYGASGVTFSKKAKEQLASFEHSEYKNHYVCMAKTPMSLSDNPSVLGRPIDFTIKVNELRLANGAGFIICLIGNILTMPGLPKEPSALKMDYLNGKVIGLN